MFKSLSLRSAGKALSAERHLIEKETFGATELEHCIKRKGGGDYRQTKF
jgi:hypothetical protein